MTRDEVRPSGRIREAGDSALMLELEAVIDPAVNARAIAIAAAVRQRNVPGVRDVVSTFHSVAVFFDPLSIDTAQVTAALREASDAGMPQSTGRTIEVPTAYGGDAGPDLAEVAAFAGCSPQAVIDRHTSRTYRVFMLGFLPGFAYMAAVDETIGAPRKATPRLRVVAGSVGIAGQQTGIYPCDSPGGWQIIGRTPLDIFNPDRTPPALFAPGDSVRFVTVDQRQLAHACGASPSGSPGGPERSTPQVNADRFITILRPGLLTTIQDSGRWGYQSLGVPVSGPMDPAAHRLANALLGNPRDAATLEATLIGPELRFEQRTWIAVVGADLHATIDAVDVPMNSVVECRSGSVLRFGDRRSGARAYIAFDGGVAVPRVLGSRATHLLGRLGGLDGRALRAGDRLPLAESPSRVRGANPSSHSLPAGGACLRVMPGPQAHHFDTSALDVLQRNRYTVSPQSDRMGYRLTGSTPIHAPMSGDMISDATFAGGLQVPPSGRPMLLMADRQTTGGYPQIAVVITADLPLAAQLAPGDWVEFEVCSRSEAISALMAQEGEFLALG